MKTRIAVGLIIWLWTVPAQAQQTSTVHLVTSPENRMQGYPFHFTVNGVSYKLKAGECMTVSVKADSVHILAEDRRWVKKEPVHLHIPAADHVYVRLLWGWKLNERKQVRFIAESICKSCFEEFLSKCKKQLAP